MVNATLECGHTQQVESKQLAIWCQMCGELALVVETEPAGTPAVR